MLNTFQDDPCCDKGLARALRDGKLDEVDIWTCPKCGCEWKARMFNDVRHWEPHELIATFRV